jgi:hypothetical protein
LRWPGGHHNAACQGSSVGDAIHRASIQMFVLNA